MAAQAIQPHVNFGLGQVVATPGAIEAMEKLNITPWYLLSRHQHGDWGDLDTEDWRANNRALQTGERLFSAYIVQNTKFWVITEADRSATTILLPAEY